MSNDTSQPQVERYSKCRHDQTMVKLSEIVVDTEAFCHRSDEKLTPDKLEDLARSLAQEGQQTPLVVVEAYWNVDADDRGELSATPTE